MNREGQSAGVHGWWTRVTVFVLLIGGSMAIAGSPASARRSLSSDDQLRHTEGINVSAHTVTTRNGTVWSGITFVDPKDVATAKLQASGSSSVQPLGPTNLSCIHSWYYIAGGAANSNWKPDTSNQTFANRIRANGNISVDPWNQWFMPCWRSGWSVEDFAFLSNATGGFVAYLHTVNLQAIISQQTDDFTMDNFTRFSICYYDGNWTYLKPPDSGAPIAYRDPATGNVFLADGPLNGNMLFNYSPSGLGSFAGSC